MAIEIGNKTSKSCAAVLFCTNLPARVAVRARSYTAGLSATIEQHRMPRGQGADLVGGFDPALILPGDRNYRVTDARVVSGISRLHLPRPAYADLANVNGASIYCQGKLIVLILAGGDASTSYTAKFTFEGGRLIRRVIVDEETGDKDVAAFGGTRNVKTNARGKSRSGKSRPW